MKRNYSDLIKDKQKRILTAKGYKFVWSCIDIVADLNGSNKYAQEMRPLKEKLKAVLNDLIIDKELSIEEIKEIIKNRKLEPKVLLSK